MNRQIYIDFISHQLSSLAFEVSTRSKDNLLDINNRCEDFFCLLLNIIFDYKLTNANKLRQNFPGIDLIDTTKKIFIQVSSTCTKSKVDHSLKEISLNIGDFDDYRFRFLSISKDASDIRGKKYSVPDGLLFDSCKDIIDISSLIEDIYSIIDISKLEKIYQCCRDNLGYVPNLTRLESGLTSVIDILSNIDLSQDGYEPNLNVYDIDNKISANDLIVFRDVINDYKVYYNSVKHVYDEYDKNGKNKSLAVLRSLHRMYVEVEHKYHGDDIYENIRKQAINEVVLNIHNNRVSDMSKEEIILYVDIILVHAFIECQIYKRP